jgi:hypothetical protein
VEDSLIGDESRAAVAEVLSHVAVDVRDGSTKSRSVSKDERNRQAR